MDLNIHPGLNTAVSKVVEYKDTAKALASGLAEVFATPAMIALMEYAALTVVQHALPKGYSTVGTEISARHLAATPRWHDGKGECRFDYGQRQGAYVFY